MEENNGVVQSVVETETTQTSSPQVEVETATPQTETKVETQPDAPPEQTDEQRKAFQELRLENKRLKDEVAARQKNESAFEMFRPKPNQFVSGEFVDQVTGEIDWTRYNAAQDAKIASSVSAQVEERLDENNARAKYPELFADPEIEQEIADRWFASNMRGESLKIFDIASNIAKRFEKVSAKAEKTGAEKALQEIQPKEQVSLTAPTQSATQAKRAQEAELDQAQIGAIRYGNDDALAEAMSKIPWANK